MNSSPMAMISTPATSFSSGWLSNRNDPSAVAVSPNPTKISENVPTKTPARASASGSTLRRSSPREWPETAAR